MKKILFVSPYSGRAGAETYLYRFLKNYDQKQFQAILITEKHSRFFASLKPKVQYLSMEEHSPQLFWKKAFSRAGEKLRKREKRNNFDLFLEQAHQIYKPDEWVLNTIIMQKAIPSARRLNVKVTSIIHEAPSAYSFTSEQGMSTLINKSDRIISNSHLACSAIATMGRDDVIMQPCFFDPNEIEITQTNSTLKSKFNIKDEDFVLVGSGSQDYNKGLELFLQISECTKQKNFKFLWIGAERHSGFNFYLNKYREKLRNNDNLIFVSEKTNDYYDFLNLGNAFLLTSFDESFSLATLEAMALGKPVLAYDCGGIRDFVSEESGRILATRHPQDWLDSILWLQQNHTTFTPSKIKALANKFSTNQQIPKLTAILADKPNK